MAFRSLPQRQRDALVFALVALPYLALVRRFWFLTDDAYISFRYMRNWAEGNGLRYNLGDQVPAEGYSNFLLVAVGSLVHRMEGNIEYVLPALTALCGLALLYLVFRLLRGPLEASLPAAALATGILGLTAPYCAWSTSGLETMSYALLFFCTVERLLLRPTGPEPIQAGLLAFGLAISRVEGLYWALLFAVLSILMGSLRRAIPWRAVGIYLATLLLPFAAYFAFRYIHFESLVSTTVAAKVDLGAERLARGFEYVAIQYLTSPLYLFALVAGPFVVRGPNRDSIGLVWLLFAGVSGYAMIVGGDFMAFGRLLIPGLAFFAVLCGVALDAAGRRYGSSIQYALGGASLALAALPGWNVHLVPEGVRAALHFRANTERYASEFDQWRLQRRRAAIWSARGAMLRAITEPGDSIVLGAIGASGYSSERYVFDTNGFVTPEVAYRDFDGQLTGVHSPGHDKSVEDLWFLEQGHRPTVLRLKLLGTPWGAPDEVDGLALQVRRLATSLEQDGLQDRYVVAFYRVLHPRDDVDPAYLIVARAIPDDVAPAAAWRRFDQAIRDYQEAGTIETVEVDYPVDLKIPRFLQRGWSWIEVPERGV